jgi:L-iditol 2-dehydrogenase
VEAVGICGSDLHAYLGHDERRPPPLILGHEVSGRALVLGAGAVGIAATLALRSRGVAKVAVGETNPCAGRW